jgi:cytochrome c peroxidase
MGFKDHPAVVAKLSGIAEYGPLFGAAFGDPKVTIERVGQAIASFERTLISVTAPIDRFIAGDKKAIPEAAQRGWELFNGKASCNSCHGHVGAFPLFSDDLFHNIGVGTNRPGFEAFARKALEKPDAATQGADAALVSELGRFAVTKQSADMGRFKTSHLRNIALTAPYMHDGSEATLKSVIEYYDSGGHQNPWLDGGMRPLGLTEQERAELVALLETFTSDDIAKLQQLGPSTR